jgi:DNA repair protein RadC
MNGYVPAGVYIVEYAFVSSKRTPEESRKGHRARLRQRFEKDGLSGFNNYEVVELLLTLALPRCDCKESAKSAIKKFGSVRGVLEASPEALKELDGVGPVSASTIKLIRAIAEYYYHERMLQDKSPLGNSKAVVDHLKLNMRTLDRECFSVVYLDAQNNATAAETLFEGTLTSSVVYPREVFKKALDRKAVSVIFAHNHPSGCIEPSENDRQITRDLVLAANLVDVRVLDHIIVGVNEHYSFADHGLMQEYRKQAMDFQESRRRLP